jgi:hypothetical protein
MTAEMWIIAVVRLLGALPVLRWPFFGGIFAIAVDQSDLFIMNLVDAGGVRDYQTFDKYLDQAYLLAFLVVALRWSGLPRLIAVGLYLFRFAGFLAFEVTQERDVLLFFPNLFEFWFLLVAGVKQFHLDATLTTRHLVLLALPLLALKLFQEYAIHYARWLDSFTAVEAVEAVWRWLPLT